MPTWAASPSFQHFFEQFASAILVTDVAIGNRQIELGGHFLPACTAACSTACGSSSLTAPESRSSEMPPKRLVDRGIDARMGAFERAGRVSDFASRLEDVEVEVDIGRIKSCIGRQALDGSNASIIGTVALKFGIDGTSGAAASLAVKATVRSCGGVTAFGGGRQIEIEVERIGAAAFTIEHHSGGDRIDWALDGSAAGVATGSPKPRSKSRSMADGALSGPRACASGIGSVLVRSRSRIGSSGKVLENDWAWLSAGAGAGDGGAPRLPRTPPWFLLQHLLPQQRRYRHCRASGSSRKMSAMRPGSVPTGAGATGAATAARGSGCIAIQRIGRIEGCTKSCSTAPVLTLPIARCIQFACNRLEGLGVLALGVDLEQLLTDCMTIRLGAQRFLEDFFSLGVTSVGNIDISFSHRIDFVGIKLALRAARSSS